MADAMYWKEITVHWGESDPFGLVYYPRIVAWFNETEHEFFRTIGFPIDQMIREDRTTFVMGEIHFRFIGPAAYGDRIATTISLAKIGERTLHWTCKARNAVDQRAGDRRQGDARLRAHQRERNAELGRDPAEDAQGAAAVGKPEPSQAEDREGSGVPARGGGGQEAEEKVGQDTSGFRSRQEADCS